MEHKEHDRPTSAPDIGRAERAVEGAFATGKADRANITRLAQADAAEAVKKVGVAIESDDEADEAARIAVIASGMGNRERAHKASKREREARKKAKHDHREATKSAKEAYDAIRFSDPSRLGFLRFFQILFIVHIANTLMSLILTTRDTVVYDSTSFATWISVILESIAFYFVVNRYKIGRPFVIGMGILGIALNIVSGFINGSFSVVGVVSESVYFIIMILYFTLSKRVKVVLVNDLAHDKGALEDEELVIDRKSWPFYRNLIMYFFVFSVLGHWMEAAFCQLIRLNIVQGDYDPTNTMLWRDWFYPYPMHGTAVILIALILYPLFMLLKKKCKGKFTPYVLSFLINMAVCTLIEFVGGLLFNANLQNWNYSNLPFNFMGQICLQNAIGFGVASSAIAWWLYPMMERAIARVRPSIMNIVCVAITAVGLILFSLYAIAPPEGVDMGQGGSAEVRRIAEDERNELEGEAKVITVGESTLRKGIEASIFLPDAVREEILKELDVIKESGDLIDKRLEETEIVPDEVLKQIDEETLVSTEFKNRLRHESEQSSSSEEQPSEQQTSSQK